MKHLIHIILLLIVSSIANSACTTSPPTIPETLSLDISPSQTTTPQIISTKIPSSPPTFTAEDDPAIGCPFANYPDWETSPYVLPFPVGKTYQVRLSNCSSSYHAEGKNDQFAFDFVMATGTLVTAARAGTVVYIEEKGISRELNNLVVVDHGDNTFAEYMHLKQYGALVKVGDFVEQGDEIGLSGATGLAGYPHLHFIVVEGSWQWPYDGVPVTFSNTSPNPNSLASNTKYTALPYP